MIENKQQDRGGVLFGPYVIGLVDFLGQASELRQWSFRPTTRREFDQFLSAVRKTWSRVQEWRRKFEATIQDWLSTADAIVDQTPAPSPQAKEQYKRFREVSTNFMHFGDTIVIFSNLENSTGYLQMGNVAAFIATLGSGLLEALANRCVFRGAIEMGMGAQFDEGDLYGPVLAEGHRLESKVALYPRIVIGKHLLGYLDYHISSQEDSPAANANRATANTCKQMICEDRDGQRIVDYLGPIFSRQNPLGMRESRGKALEFVAGELDRFKQQGNDCLVQRYRMLLNYFERRTDGTATV